MIMSPSSPFSVGYDFLLIVAYARIAYILQAAFYAGKCTRFSCVICFSLLLLTNDRLINAKAALMK